MQGRGCFCPPPLSALSFCTNTNVHAEPGNPGPFEFCVSVSSPYSTTWQKVVLKYSLNWACSITMLLDKRFWSKAIDWYLREWMTIINSYVNTWTAVKHNFSIGSTLLSWNYRSMYTRANMFVTFISFYRCKGPGLEGCPNGWVFHLLQLTTELERMHACLHFHAGHCKAGTSVKSSALYREVTD